MCVCVCGFRTSGDAFRLPFSIAFGCSIRPFFSFTHGCIYPILTSLCYNIKYERDDSAKLFFPVLFWQVTNLRSSVCSVTGGMLLTAYRCCENHCCVWESTDVSKLQIFGFSWSLTEVRIYFVVNHVALHTTDECIVDLWLCYIVDLWLLWIYRWKHLKDCRGRSVILTNSCNCMPILRSYLGFRTNHQLHKLSLIYLQTSAINFLIYDSAYFCANVSIPLLLYRKR